MFSLLYNKKPRFLSPVLRNFCDLRYLECSSLIITRSFTSTIHNLKQLKDTSFTVSYLINSCGLSPEDAISASNKVKFQNLERPDSVLSLLKKHEFSNTQITKIVKSNPRILSADPEKCILSKIEFFSSIGICGPNLAEFISSKPQVLRRSLNNQISRVYKFLKSVLPPENSLLIKALSNALEFFVVDEATVRTNLSVLREVGMPQSVIELLVIHRLALLSSKVDIFHRKIDEVISMGFHPTETKIIHALSAKIKFSELQWLHKIEVYRRFGWSNDEVMSVFKRYPQCMTLSEKKIVGSMDFLIHVMDMKPSAIASYPYFFTFSLKKRTIPRGLVVKILMLKGLLEKNKNVSILCHRSDEWFFKEYVEKHREQIPYLADVFEGRISARELGFQYGQ